MNRTRFAVAALAAAVALQGAFLHAVVARPLASAVHDAAEPQRATFEESITVQAVANLYLPSLNADIINNGVATGDTAYILSRGGIMLGAALAMGVAAIIAVYWGSKTSMAFGRDVRAAIFTKVQTFSQQEVNIFGAPSLITRNTNDVQQVQLFLQIALTFMVSAPILASLIHSW